MKWFSRRAAGLQLLPDSCLMAIDGDALRHGKMRDRGPYKTDMVLSTNGPQRGLLSNTLLGLAPNSAGVTPVTGQVLTGRPLSLSVWYKFFGNLTEQIWGQGFQTYRFSQVNALCDLRLNSNNKVVAFSDDALPGVWTHYAATWAADGSIRLFRDGRLDKTDSYTTDFASPAAYNFHMNQSVNILNSIATRGRIYNAALTDQQLIEEYNTGAQAIQFRVEDGYPLTGVLSVGSRIGPFEILGGTAQVVNTTINGKPIKAIEIISATGVIGLQIEKWADPQECALGSWDIHYYKVAAGNSLIGFAMSNNVAPNATDNTGYFIWHLPTLKIQLRRNNGGGSTTNLIDSGNNAYTAPAWLRYEITRDNRDYFTFDLNGTSIGTVTDSTFRTAKHIVFNGVAGERIALDGHLTKYLGAIR